MPSHSPQSYLCTTLYMFYAESLKKYAGRCTNDSTAHGWLCQIRSKLRRVGFLFSCLPESETAVFGF